MTKQIDFSSDYEGLSGQLCDLVEVIDLALVHDTKKTAMATLNVTSHSLNHLITWHSSNADSRYKTKEVNHERA